MLRARAAALLAVVGVLATGLVAVASGPATVPPRRGYVGDFDGDGRSDIYWSVPGPAPEVFQFAEPDGTFAVEQVPLDGTYTPLVGDFDGDGASDVVQYRPGGGTFAWYGGRDRGMSLVRVPVTGSYRPVVGDFDGDEMSDILWYRPGSAPDTIWYGRSNRHFTQVSLSLDGALTLRSGDLDGDGRDDVLSYGKGVRVWYATAQRGSFVPTDRRSVGRAKPTLGDFDGDGTTDVFWYAAGKGPDYLDLDIRLVHAYRHIEYQVDRTYHVVAGDFDGDGVADLMLSGKTDEVWYGSHAGMFFGTTVTSSADAAPLGADFDGDHRADLYWPDRAYVWYGTLQRSFTRAAVHTKQNRVAPLRPDVWAKSYEPYGMVAHAMGGIDGYVYTNSLEAFQASYAKGFRVFEADFLELRDGTIFVAHDGMEAHYGLDVPFGKATLDDLQGHFVYGRYTPLTGMDALALLRTYRDVYLILDTKYDEVDIVRRMLLAEPDPQVARRLLPHIADQAELDAIRRYYPLQHYVLALYRTQWAGRYDDPEALAFVKRNGAPAVMMWYRERDPAKTLVQNSEEGRRYTAQFAAALRDAGAVVYVHSLHDEAAMKPYADSGIGVYSDGPYPTEGLARL
jgi:glycerophosphoryl diester phosphodiesterase